MRLRPTATWRGGRRRGRSSSASPDDPDGAGRSGRGSRDPGRRARRALAGGAGGLSEALSAVAVGAVAVLAGGIASVAGFEIGSLLTPALAVFVGTKLAVAVVQRIRFHGPGAWAAGALSGLLGGLVGAWRLLAPATGGVLIGTLLGEMVLRRLPDRAFRRTVSALILLVGIVMLARAG